MKLRLDLKLSQRLIMTPQLQQAIKLLQLSRLELQQSLQQHLMENPLLEELAAEVEEAEESNPEQSREDMPLSYTTSEASIQSEQKSETAENPEEIYAGSWEV